MPEIMKTATILSFISAIAISAARLIEDISHTAPIKEVGLKEAKIDDIIRTVYQQGNAAG